MAEKFTDTDFFSCSICLLELPSDEKVKMPCCNVEGSSLSYCKRCIEIISENGINGSIGKCPTCTSYYTVSNKIVCTVRSFIGKCSRCMQPKDIADRKDMLCEACLLGTLHSYHYECQKCHKIQVILHPMWR